MLERKERSQGLSDRQPCRWLNKVSVAFRDNEFRGRARSAGLATTMLTSPAALTASRAGDLVIDGISTKGLQGTRLHATANNRIGFAFQVSHLIP